MIPVLVLGYGNTLRRDDGAGALVARALEGRWPEDQARVEPLRQLLVEHAALLAGAGHCVFVDAAVGYPPGAVSAVAIDPVEPRGASLTHHVSPENLLAAARALYGRAPTAHVVTIGARELGHGETLSPAVARALPRAVEATASLVEARLGGRSRA